MMENRSDYCNDIEDRNKGIEVRKRRETSIKQDIDFFI